MRASEKKNLFQDGVNIQKWK